MTVNGFKHIPKFIGGRSNRFEMQLSEVVYKGF